MMNETSTKLLIVDDLPENLRALNALIRESDRSVYQPPRAKKRWPCCWNTISRWPSSTCKCRKWMALNWRN